MTYAKSTITIPVWEVRQAPDENGCRVFRVRDHRCGGMWEIHTRDTKLNAVGICALVERLGAVHDLRYNINVVHIYSTFEF